jgi:DNA-binding beta-propeller fold protein YncE
MRRRVVMVTLLAACGAEDPAIEPGVDAGVEPCVLPSLAQTVATLAGCSRDGTIDGTREHARFSNPTNVVIAANGVAYITDFDSSRLRSIDPAGNTATVYQDDSFKRPFGIALAPGGKLYVETDDNDQGAHSTLTGTLWLVDPVAGTAEVLARDLGRPRGLAVLPDGRIAMADHMHHVISIFDPIAKTETVIAGKEDEPGHANGIGSEARFDQPYDLVVMPDGALVVSDYDNHRLRRVLLDGSTTDFAGSGTAGALNGPVDVASFDAPQALAVLPTGVLYVTDVKRKLVRKIASGTVSTVAGDGTPGWLDAANARDARFYGLEGMDIDAARLVVADGNIGDDSPHHHIRVVQLSGL